MDTYGVFFVVDTIQMLHHAVVEFPTRLAYILIFAFEAVGKINDTGGGTCEESFQIKCLVAMV